MTEKDLIVATNQEQRQTVEDASDEKTEISVKPAKNFEEQIEILRTRKLYIENNAEQFSHWSILYSNIRIA